MKSEEFKKLRPLQATERKLMGALILACLALLAAGIGFEWQARRAVLENAEQSSRNLVVSVLDQVNETLHQADLLTSLVAWQLEAAGQTLPLMADLQAELRHHVEMRSALQDLYVYDSAGHLVHSSYAHRRYEASVQGRDFFEQHRHSSRADLHIGRPYRTEPHQEWVIPVSRRLFGPQGSFSGVVVAALSMKHLSSYLGKFELGPQGLLAVTTRGATILVRRPFRPEAIGADLSQSSLNRNHFSRAASGSFIESSPIDGIERQYSFHHSQAYPVLVMAARSKAHVLAGWREMALRNAVVVGGMILLVVLAGRRTLRALEGQQSLTRKLKDSYRRLADMERAVDEHASVVTTDVHGRITAVNEKFCALSQYAQEELIGNTHRLVNSGRHPASFFEEMWHTISQGGVWKGEIENRAKDGSIYWMATTIVPFLDEVGQPYQYIAIRTDITERKRAEQKLVHLNAELARLAAHDELTGLANRRRFNEVLGHEFKRARRSGEALSVLLLDVDFFKRFNDTYGHAAGDLCLKFIATAAQSVARRPGDLPARWGGEEFAVLLPQTDAAGAMAVAERLRSEVQALAVEHGGSPLKTVTVSIGAHCIGEWLGDESMEDFMHAADQALYRAKAAGRNQVVGAWDSQADAERAAEPSSPDEVQDSPL